MTTMLLCRIQNFVVGLLSQIGLALNHTSMKLELSEKSFRKNCAQLFVITSVAYKAVETFILNEN